MPPMNISRTEEISFLWSDEQLCKWLESIQTGSCGASLPRNVLTDVNPYPNHPANLPEGIWYVVHSKDPKQAKVGFWKANGDPCQIYSDSLIIGWRTTFEFYEGGSPNDHRTGWVMQEYSISDLGSSSSSNVKGVRSLCRVFHLDREGKTDNPDQQQANADVKGQTDLSLVDSKSDKPLKSKLHEEMERYQAMLPQQADLLLHGDCIAEGDYIEMLDLIDPQSSSSSSDNSSCVSVSSDVYFDSIELLQELENETNPSSYKYSTSRPDDIIVTVVADQGSIVDGKNETEESDKVEVSEHGITLKRRHPDKKHVSEHAKTPPPPVSSNVGASSSRHPPGGDKGKKVVRVNSIKKFFCFLSF